MRQMSLTLFCGTVVAVLSVAILLSWQLGLGALENVIQGFPKTMPLTATLLLALGVSLVFLKIRSDGDVPACCCLCRLSALCVMAIGLYVLCEYGCDRLPRIERSFMRAAIQQSGEDLPGRPSPHTLLALIFFGFSIFLSSFGQLNLRKNALLFVLCAGIIVWLVLFGYASAANPFYALPSHPKIGMGLLTVASMMFLGTGIAALYPQEAIVRLFWARASGSTVVKTLLPVALGAPLFFSWVVVAMNFLNKEHLFLAISASMAVTGLLFAGLVIWVGLLINRHETEKALEARQREKLIVELEQTAGELQTLQKNFLTVCAWTHKVLDHGQWVSMEEFLKDRLGLTISHGLSDESLMDNEPSGPKTEQLASSLSSNAP